MTKSFPFKSSYLPDFQVVEERDGNVTRYPHTDQLPKLWRALDLDFRSCLPEKIASTDHRSNDFLKMQRNFAVQMFCGYINQNREDGLRLHPLLDRNRVSRISIAQQITERTELGAVHRFKFFGGDDFFTDIYLNGKQITFADHALERFSERVPVLVGTQLINLFDAFFCFPAVLLECNNNPAFVHTYGESVIAFPVRPSDTEYFLPTCLSVNEINNLELVFPPPAFTPHYDPIYKEPEIRNWDTVRRALGLHNIWKRKIPLSKPELTPAIDKMSWSTIAHKIKDIYKKQGHGKESRFMFRDNIFGPSTISLLPEEKEECHTLLEDLKRWIPETDWDQVVPEMKAENPEWYGGVQIGGQP